MTPLVITVKKIFIFHAFNCNPEYMTTHHPEQTVGYLQMDVFAQLETSYLLFHTAQNDWLLVLTVLVRHVIVKVMRVYVFRVMDMVFSVMIITIYQVLMHIFYKLYPLLLLTDVRMMIYLHFFILFSCWYRCYFQSFVSGNLVTNSVIFCKIGHYSYFRQVQR